jgi:hypothetical protein
MFGSKATAHARGQAPLAVVGVPPAVLKLDRSGGKQLFVEM